MFALARGATEAAPAASAIWPVNLDSTIQALVAGGRNPWPPPGGVPAPFAAPFCRFQRWRPEELLAAARASTRRRRPLLLAGIRTEPLTDRDFRRSTVRAFTALPAQRPVGLAAFTGAVFGRSPARWRLDRQFAAAPLALPDFPVAAFGAATHEGSVPRWLAG